MNDRINKIIAGIANSGRVAGAYLFVGAKGAGKKEAAGLLADRLGCQKQDRFAIAPDGASLKIEQVRELQSLVRYGPTISSQLVAVVNQADTLTDQAAAAFLKTLEEPPPGVVFLLLAEREDKLPLTIRSRCQKIIFPEKNTAWQPQPELAGLVAEFGALPKQGLMARLAFSTKLGKEKELLPSVLAELLLAARYQLGNVKLARALLSALYHLKRNVNAKTALDCLCLSI